MGLPQLKQEIPIEVHEDDLNVIRWDRETETVVLDALMKASVAQQDVVLIDGSLYQTNAVYAALFGVPCVGEPTPQHVERMTAWRK